MQFNHFHIMVIIVLEQGELIVLQILLSQTSTEKYLQREKRIDSRVFPHAAHPAL